MNRAEGSTGELSLGLSILARLSPSEMSPGLIFTENEGRERRLKCVRRKKA